MLVLSRKKNEEIVVERHGEELLRVTVLSTGKSRIRLGFEAPPDIGIRRAEADPKPQP